MQGAGLTIIAQEHLGHEDMKKDDRTTDPEINWRPANRGFKISDKKKLLLWRKQPQHRTEHLPVKQMILLNPRLNSVRTFWTVNNSVGINNKNVAFILNDFNICPGKLHDRCVDMLAVREKSIHVRVKLKLPHTQVEWKVVCKSSFHPNGAQILTELLKKSAKEASCLHPRR